MAVAFLARQAPFRSSGRAVLLGALALLDGCTGSGAGQPAWLVDHGPGWQEQAGVLLFEGRPYSGTVYVLGIAGDTLRTTPYQQGREQGLARAWYGPGRLRERRPFVAGREQGLAEGWWPNGQRGFRRAFWAGVYQGEVCEWYPTGQCRRLAHYRAGQEAGRQQFWLPDGSLSANYEARNGRQYGFIGSKHCVSPQR